MSEDAVKETKGKKPEAETKTPAPASSQFELVLKQYDVTDPSTGINRRITAEVLAADPELLAWMQKNHPACFKS